MLLQRREPFLTNKNGARKYISSAVENQFLNHYNISENSRVCLTKEQVLRIKEKQETLPMSPDDLMEATDPSRNPQTGAKRVSVRSPALLRIQNGSSISYGANQEWYPTRIGRLAGCGPTTASNLLWYLAASRPKACGNLFTGNGAEHTAKWCGSWNLCGIM